MCYGCRNCGKCGKASALKAQLNAPCPACGTLQKMDDKGKCVACGSQIAPPMVKSPKQANQL